MLIDRQPPERLEMFLRMFDLHSREELIACLSNYSYNLADIMRLARGNPFDNTNTLYFGSNDDATLNREVPRYSADPEARRYLAQWGDVTGEIEGPVLIVQSIVDPLVPPESVQFYDDITQQKGTADKYVRLWVDQTSVSFPTAVVEAAFQRLHDWVVDGARPEPGELTP
jgi:hypothetical protein